MFRRVVWATDGSELARRALPFALELASRGGELVALHIEERVIGVGGAPPVRVEEPELQQELEQEVALLRAQGVDARLVVDTVSVTGIPEAIAEATDLLDGDVIVVATHGRGALGTAIHGSVARTLLQKAHCPVFAIPVLHMDERAGAGAGEAHARR